MKGLFTKNVVIAAVVCFLLAQCVIAVNFNAPLGNRMSTTQQSITPIAKSIGGAQRILGNYNYTAVLSKYSNVQARPSQVERIYQMKIAERNAKNAWKRTKLAVQYKNTAITAIPASHIRSGVPLPTPVNSTNSTATPA